jgi:hypothetical protein
MPDKGGGSVRAGRRRLLLRAEGVAIFSNKSWVSNMTKNVKNKLCNANVWDF